jgi:acyl-CoA thioesterase-1
MKRFPFPWVFFAFTLSLFCTTQALARTTIVVLGDSISSGYGIETTQSWVALLEPALKQKDPLHSFQVINASITGDTTAGGLARLPALLNHLHPELMIIELGGNDGLRGISLRSSRDNFVQMIKLSQQAGSKVMLLGMRMPPNYGKKYTDGFANNYRDLAKAYHLVWVPCIYAKVYTNPGLMQDDGIHPNALGQKQVLNNVLPSILYALSLGPKVKTLPDCTLP